MIKSMRERGCWLDEQSPWADKGSRKKLWTQNALIAAIAYVSYEQGE